MPCTHKNIIFLLAFVLFIFMLNEGQGSPDYNFPITVIIPNGLKVHFGDYWISTSGTSIYIHTWFVSDWLTYTVDTSGIQEIYNGSKPSMVFVDEVRKEENDLWSYSSGIVTVTGALSIVSLCWAKEISGTDTDGIEEISSNLVLFIVTVAGDPAVNCRIRIYALPDDYYRGCLITDERGEARTYLGFGEYRYEAEFEGMTKQGSFLHYGYQEIPVNFEKVRFKIRFDLFKIIALMVIGLIAIYAIGKIKIINRR